MGIVTDVYNPNTYESGTEGSHVQGGLGYIARPCLLNTKVKKKVLEFSALFS
jgi:hypothetical protein